MYVLCVCVVCVVCVLCVRACETATRVEVNRLTYVLQITGKQLPEWGFHQLEVTADRHISQRDTVWNVEEHRYTKSQPHFFHSVK